MLYRISTKFETLYTHEQEFKIEFTEDLASAKRTFTIYMENPEVIMCTLDIVRNRNDITCKKIIAAYSPI